MSKNRIHLNIIITHLAKNINNFANRTLVFSIRPLDNSYHRLVIGLSSLYFSSRNDDVVSKDIARCHEVSQILIYFQTSYEGILSAFKDFVDLCLLDVILTASEEGEFHPISIKCSHRITFRNENRLLAIIRDNRVFAICLSNEFTFHHLYALIQAIRIITYLSQVVIPCHFLHNVNRQHLERMRRETEGTEYLFKAERFARSFGKEFLQHLSELRFIHSFATFFTFSHKL